jgi:hypothetical protein
MTIDRLNMVHPPCQLVEEFESFTCFVMYFHLSVEAEEQKGTGSLRN